MEARTRRNENRIKTAFIITILLLLGSIFYIYKLQTERVELLETKTSLISNKYKLQSELEVKISEYKIIIAENAELRTKLEEEKNKLIALLAQVKKSDGNISSLVKYKVKFEQINKDISVIESENNLLKENNLKLSKELENSVNKIKEVKGINDTLRNFVNTLKNNVEKSKKISLSNLETTAFMINKRTSKQIQTDKSYKTDVLKIKFTIAENLSANKGDRIFYVQVIDSKGNVLGEKKGVNLNGSFLSYSFSKVINYNNKTILVQEDLPISKLTSGSIKVNVYDNEGNVLNTTFYLN